MVLRVSASLGFYELAKLELDMGATDHIISVFPENSLHLAAMGGHTRLVKLLVDYGADVNSLCKSRDTPLSHAIASGNHEVVQLLLNSGPSVATGAMEELRLESDISKQCSTCGQSKSFIVIKKLPNTSHNMFDESVAPIFIKEVIYLLLKPNHEVNSGGNTNQIIPIKWFPGASMYRALALAANLGIDHVEKLLSMAGNTLDPFDEMVSFLCQGFANMVII
ncbi:ankyrin [Stipitochalara longipes BDJ]|nr:ankyrin [Stipitochalara longipes BDJ]